MPEPIAGWPDVIPAALRLAARIPAPQPIRLAADCWPMTDYGACGRDILAAIAQAHPGRTVSLHDAATGRAMCGVVAHG